MIKEKIKYLKEKLNFKVIYIIVCLVFLAGLLYFNKTHAYYSSESEWIPIFTSKVGNFAGKGDTSPLNKPTDINVMYYIQSGMDLKKYDVLDMPPVNVESNYVLDEKKSNCIPTDATYTKTLERDFSIASDGTVTINVSEKTPKQVVCRIYYNFNLVDYKEKDGDVKVITYIESDTGSIVTKKNNKSYIVDGEIPKGYTMSSYDCDNAGTQVTYNEIQGLSYSTTGKNTCRAYFDKP